MQPLGQGISHTLKAICISKTFETITDRLDNDKNKNIIIIHVWKELFILDHVENISSTCKEMKTLALNAC